MELKRLELKQALDQIKKIMDKKALSILQHVCVYVQGNSLCIYAINLSLGSIRIIKKVQGQGNGIDVNGLLVNFQNFFNYVKASKAKTIKLVQIGNSLIADDCFSMQTELTIDDFPPAMKAESEASCVVLYGKDLYNAMTKIKKAGLPVKKETSIGVQGVVLNFALKHLMATNGHYAGLVGIDIDRESDINYAFLINPVVFDLVKDENKLDVYFVKTKSQGIKGTKGQYYTNQQGIIKLQGANTVVEFKTEDFDYPCYTDWFQERVKGAIFVNQVALLQALAVVGVKVEEFTNRVQIRIDNNKLALETEIIQSIDCNSNGFQFQGASYNVKYLQNIFSALDNKLEIRFTEDSEDRFAKLLAMDKKDIWLVMYLSY